MAKQKYGSNIYTSTTIFSIIGTIIYALIAYFFYPSYVNTVNVIVFFVIVWVVYYFIVKSRKKKGY